MYKRQVWAYLHKGTVCVLSLGLLVDRAGFTFLWRPGRVPELVLGKVRTACTPSFNVPFIYTSRYLEERRRRRAVRGDPKACPGKAKDKDPSFEQVLKGEMKGMEDLLSPPLVADDSEGEAEGPGAAQRGDPARRPGRSRP